jgi:hypothetical protein
MCGANPTPPQGDGRPEMWMTFVDGRGMVPFGGLAHRHVAIFLSDVQDFFRFFHKKFV